MNEPTIRSSYIEFYTWSKMGAARRQYLDICSEKWPSESFCLKISSLWLLALERGWAVLLMVPN